jgi:hypothetical protein
MEDNYFKIIASPLYLVIDTGDVKKWILNQVQEYSWNAFSDLRSKSREVLILGSSINVRIQEINAWGQV